MTAAQNFHAFCDEEELEYKDAEFYLARNGAKNYRARFSIENYIVYDKYNPKGDEDLWKGSKPAIGLEGRDFAIAVVNLEKKAGEIPDKFP